MSTATLTRPLSPAAVAYAYAALDHVLTNPDLHDESVLIRYDGRRAVCCYGVRIALCAGYSVNGLGDVRMDSLRQGLQDEAREGLDGGDAADPEFPPLWVDVSDLVRMLLGIDADLTEALFNVPSNRGQLCRVIRRTFGPRPLSDDGALEMTPAEIEAELAKDLLGALVHAHDPFRGRMCGAVAGRAVSPLSLEITCERCADLVAEGSKQLLAAVREIGEGAQS